MIILYNQLNLLHKLKQKYHPQRPQRITQTINYLKSTSYSKFISTYQELLSKSNIKDQELQKITLNQIIQIHGQKYYQFVEGMWCQGISKPQMFISTDTYYTKQTYQAAFQAVKTTILAVQQGLQEKISDSICLVRPPGHHSGRQDKPHGFCFFNNVAIAANYFVQKTKKKAVIIDWDIHHGQGTQTIFYNRNDIFYISLHRYDRCMFFPHIKYSGPKYTGEGKGAGFNLNIAWNFPNKPKDQRRQSSQTVRDQQYLYCFRNYIQPILKQYDFEAIFISCGFDCAQGDPIGDSHITRKGFEYMSNILKSFKKQIFVVLEGGYNIDTIKWGTQSIIQGLSPNYDSSKIPEVKLSELNSFAQQDLQIVKYQIQKHWKI